MKFDKLVDQLMEQSMNPAIPPGQMMPQLGRGRSIDPGFNRQGPPKTSIQRDMEYKFNPNLRVQELRVLVQKHFPELLDKSKYPKKTQGYFGGQIPAAPNAVDTDKIDRDELSRQIKMKMLNNPAIGSEFSRVEKHLSDVAGGLTTAIIRTIVGLLGPQSRGV